MQGIWTARQLEMTDLRRGSRTRLTLDKLEYNVPLKDEDFTLQAIRAASDAADCRRRLDRLLRAASWASRRVAAAVAERQRRR